MKRMKEPSSGSDIFGSFGIFDMGCSSSGILVLRPCQGGSVSLSQGIEMKELSRFGNDDTGKRHLCLLNTHCQFVDTLGQF